MTEVGNTLLDNPSTSAPILRMNEQEAERVVKIEGGYALSGTIAEVGGAKNSGYKLMIAACLAEGPTTLHGMPNIGDVKTTATILASLGAIVRFSDDMTTVEIDPGGISRGILPRETGEASRASILTAAILLSRGIKAEIPLPGGDKLGNRPIDIHLDGLRAMGATVDESQLDRVVLTAENGLQGTDFRLKVPSHMGTEHLIMAATRALGTTILRNCAQEPEVDALIDHLRKAGATISSYVDPTDGRVIKIEGVRSLAGTENNVMVDRNAVVTYAVAALATESTTGITVKGANRQHIESFLTLLDEMNGGYEITEEGIRFFYKEGGLKAPKRVIITGPHPGIISDSHIGIMTDWQALVSVLLVKAHGTSTLVEAIYPNRFQHLSVAKRSGANIVFFDPKAEDPKVHYLFTDKEADDYPNHGARITGGTILQPIHLKGSDVRLGAFGTLMGLLIPGESTVLGITQIQRGYHKLISNLQSVGAKITVS